MNEGQVRMRPTTWPAMCGNGLQTGMTSIIIRPVQSRTLKGHRAVISKSGGAAPGAMIQPLYDQRSGAGSFRQGGVRLSGFGVPKTPRNPRPLFLDPYRRVSRGFPSRNGGHGEELHGAVESYPYGQKLALAISRGFTSKPQHGNVNFRQMWLI